MWTIRTCPTTVLLSTVSECVCVAALKAIVTRYTTQKCDVDLYAPQGVDLGEGGSLSYWHGTVK